MADLLGGVDLRPLNVQGIAASLRPVGLALGSGPSAIEIAVFATEGRPAAAELRQAWRKRSEGRAAPVLVVATYGDRAAILGPNDADAPAHFDIPIGIVDSICRAALGEPDRHAARKLLATALRTIDAHQIPGLRNDGLLATHHLRHNVPKRSDWLSSAGKAAPALALRDEALVRGLDFEIEHASKPGVVLRHAGTKVAIAILVTRGTDVDAAIPQFGGLSPVSYGLERAREENLPYLLVAEGASLRLYATAVGAGVGRRGRTETFVEVRLDMLGAERAAYLWLLFSADALRRGGTVEQLLRESQDYAADLGTRLRERIYTDVVPQLASGVAGAMQVRNDTAQLRETYEVALTLRHGSRTMAPAFARPTS